MKNTIIKTPYRIKVILYSLLICIPLIFIVQKAYADIVPMLQLLLFEEVDAPDECGHPKTPNLTIGKTIKGKLTIGDHDFIRIRNHNFYQNVKLFTTGGTDTVGELWNNTCTEIVDSNDDPSIGILNFSFEYNLEAGKTYYLNVRGYRDIKKGEYKLKSQITKEYVYLSAKHNSRGAEEQLGTNVDDPYHPEFGDSDYSNLGEVNAYDKLEESYYFSVDPNGQRTTLQAWKDLHGFTNNSNVVTAEYINAYDLGVGRKMSCLMNSNVATISRPCVVENYTIGHNPDNPRTPKIFASVAMERVKNKANPSGSFSNRHYTAFYVFDSDGRRINSIDLDGSGRKRVPESCWSCHDGARFSFRHGGQEGSNNGQYLPFDIKLFRQFPGGPTINSQLDKFRKLNDIVYQVYLDDMPTVAGFYRDAHKQISDLIKHWYNGKPPRNANPFIDNNFSTARILGAPSSHNGARAEFYGQYCQTCHVSQPLSPVPSTPRSDCTICHSASSGGTDGVPNLKKVLCKNSQPNALHMPNAKVTHLRYIQENFNPNGTVRFGSKLYNLDNTVSGNLCSSGYETEIYPKN